MNEKMRPADRIMAAVHDGTRGLHAIGAIDSARMAEFDALCLVPAPHYLNGRKLRKLRRRFKLKKERLARLLSTSVDEVRDWENGVATPNDAALQLLELLEREGLDALEAQSQALAHEASSRAQQVG